MASIDRIPNSDGRARIGFITVSHAIGFYNLGNKEPELLMMPDIDDIYLPRAHTDLVVNLNEAKSVVLDLLERLKVMFTHETFAANDNCLGAALKAARQLLVSFQMHVVFPGMQLKTTCSLQQAVKSSPFKQACPTLVLVHCRRLLFTSRTAWQQEKACCWSLPASFIDRFQRNVLDHMFVRICLSLVVRI